MTDWHSSSPSTSGIILLTAKGELSDRLLGLETGADDYLVKPCDQAELMARVRAGLRIVLLTRDLRDTISELRDTQSELSSAREDAGSIGEIAAVCSGCRKVQTADEEWQELEHLLSARGRVGLVAALCPVCHAGEYPAELRRASGE